ncbi:MAG: DUF3465 domain-containing protein [Phycisphaerales bacterium]
MPSLPRTPGGPPPLLKLVGTIVVLLVMAALGVPIALNSGGTTAPPASSSQTPPTTQPSASNPPASRSPQRTTPARSTQDDGLAALREMVASRVSGRMLTVTTTVFRVLDDDNDGARHQRFLILLDPDDRRSGTVKISHNIDLAPRVPLEQGDTVTIRGQFEWNDLGGVIHWTHHDPGGRREGGWIEHAGRRYE